MTKTLLMNANLFDGNHDDFQTNSFIGFNDEDGRIIETGQGTATATYDQTFDLHGQFLMPGMINAHSHITSGPTGMTSSDARFETPAWQTQFAMKNMKSLLENGITYTRSVGVANDIDIAISAMQREGFITGAGVIASGGAFTMTGGHFSESSHEVDSPDEMRKGVRQLLKMGAKNIKFMATGGVSWDGETPNDIQLTEAEMRAGVIEAHHKGIPVAAHAQGNEGIKNAVRAGVDSIEHGFYIDDEAVELMLEHGTTLVPTLNAMWAIINRGQGLLPDWMMEKATGHWLAHKASVEKAAKAGIPIAMGTDAGTPFNDFANDSMWELELMQTQSNLTPLQILQSATRNGAKLLRIDGDYGTLETGKFADFIITEKSPLTDLKQLQGEKLVFQHGTQRAGETLAELSQTVAQ